MMPHDAVQEGSRKRLSVLVAGIKWPPETFLAQLIKGLAEAGVAVTVASPVKPDEGWLAHPRLRWVIVPLWAGSILRRLLRLGSLFVQALVRSPGDVRRLAPHVHCYQGYTRRLHLWHRLLPLIGRPYDVIYFPWNAGAVTYEPLLALGQPMVVSCRGSQINIRPHLRGGSSFAEDLKRTFGKAAMVHCVSEAICEEAERIGLDRQRAQVIHPAVDPSFFRLPERVRPGNGVFQIVTVGSLVWGKGYEDALLALRRLVDQGLRVHLKIIGEGPERTRLSYTIYDLELEKHVQLLGRLVPRTVRDTLWEADAFMLSSVSEGISNAVLEAMACGVPIVATDCGGMREAITDGVEGFLVPIRDPSAMTEALKRLITSRGLCRAMGAAGRERVLNAFTLDRQIDAFKNLFEQVS